MAGSKSWSEIRRGLLLNEARIRTHRRLMSAEDALDPRRSRLGVDETAISEALDAAEADAGEEDLFLAAVSRYAAALGGHVEVRAMFPDESVVVLVEGQR